MDLFIFSLFRALAICVAASMAIPYLSIVCVACFIVMFFIKRYICIGQNESKRLDACTKPMVNSAFQECVAGLMTIRAYKKVAFFEDRFNQASDLNSACVLTYQASTRFLGQSLNFVALFLVIGNALFALLMKGYHTEIVIV